MLIPARALRVLIRDEVRVMIRVNGEVKMKWVYKLSQIIIKYAVPDNLIINMEGIYIFYTIFTYNLFFSSFYLFLYLYIIF